MPTRATVPAKTHNSAWPLVSAKAPTGRPIDIPAGNIIDIEALHRPTNAGGAMSTTMGDRTLPITHSPTANTTDATRTTPTMPVGDRIRHVAATQQIPNPTTKIANCSCSSPTRDNKERLPRTMG